MGTFYDNAGKFSQTRSLVVEYTAIPQQAGQAALADSISFTYFSSYRVSSEKAP